MITSSLSFLRLSTFSFIAHIGLRRLGIPLPSDFCCPCPTLGETGLAGAQTRVREIPRQCLMVWMLRMSQTRLMGFLPSRALSLHNTTRLRPAAYPTQRLWNPQRNTLWPGKSVLRVKGGLLSSFHSGVSRRLLWEMVLYSWLCPLCFPKALSREGLLPRNLWATTSLLVVNSHSLTLEVGGGSGSRSTH